MIIFSLLFVVLRTGGKIQISMFVCEWDLGTIHMCKITAAIDPSPFPTFPLLRCKVECLKYRKLHIFLCDTFFAEFKGQWVFLKYLVF